MRKADVLLRDDFLVLVEFINTKHKQQDGQCQFLYDLYFSRKMQNTQRGRPKEVHRRHSVVAENHRVP